MSLLRVNRLIALLFAIVSPRLFPQATAPDSEIPKDPVALMSLAHEKNGLDSPDVQPWHIRGHYTFYDQEGKPREQGVYEEWWVSPTKYKRSFSSPRFSQTDYANGAGLFRAGSQLWPTGAEILLRESLLDPLPGDEMLKEFKLKEKAESVGKLKLPCVTLEYPLRSNLTASNDFFPRSCFDTAKPVLLLNSTSGTRRTIYNQIVSFQGHYVARELHMYLSGNARVDLAVDVLEQMKDPPESLVAPPSDAIPVDLANISLQSDHDSTWPQRLKDAFPEYPQSAKSMRVQGKVVLQIRIGTDGHVNVEKAISGPLELQKPAVDAVSQWLFRPFRVLGEPRTVVSQATVIFTLGR